MTVALVSGTSTTQLAEVDLTATSPNCKSVTGGGTQCTVGFAASAGNDTFKLTMFDQTGGKGNVLSTGTVAATLTSGESTSVPVVLDGVAANVSLVLGTGTLPVGSTGSTSVIVQATDADGNIIVGPGGFSTPVTLAISGDKYNTLSLSSTSVTSPGQVVTLSYNGGTNVGSTIVPSIGKTAGTPATFGGSGAALTQIAPNLKPPSGYNNWVYPADVAALPNGKVAALFEVYKYSCSTSCGYTYAWAIGVGSTSGFQKYYVGDTTDAYNTSAATSDFSGETGVSVVKGMSLNLIGWGSRSEQEHALVSDSNGNLYYGGSFSSTSAPSCAAGTLNSGVIGVFNPSTSTTKEFVLKGVPQELQIDSNGNVWFTEQSGTCNGSSLFSSGWGIGELKAGSTTPVETDFANISGMPSNAYPYAMNITPDGSAMFVADGYTGGMLKVTTSGMTATEIALTNTTYPYGIAAGPDGTAYWITGDSSTNDDYYYGYIEGSKPFADASVQEALFPVPYFYGYDAIYADGSYWGAGYDDYGFGRTSGLSTGSPEIQFYSTQAPYYVEPYSLSAGGGYIWAADDDYDSVVALQYGEQSTATTTIAGRKAMENSATAKINSWRRIGTFSTVPVPSFQKLRQAQLTKHHG